MKRREFITLGLGLAAALWPPSLRAQQQAKTFRIVIADPARKVADISEANGDWAPFFREMRLLGYVEGGNLIVERRSAEGRPERFADLAREAVTLHPDVIVSGGTALAAELKTATQTIPIVTVVGDPIAFGLITSMARPGGNITGYSVDPGLAVYGKSLELLRLINPLMSKFTLLAHRYQWDERWAKELLRVARQLNIEMVREPLDSFDEDEFRRVTAAFVSKGVGGVIISAQIELLTRRRQFIDLLNKAQLPTVCPFDVYVRDGGLISYSPDLEDLNHLTAQYVDRILKGASPAELPFLQPTKFRTVINLKTARALGLDLPATLLTTANEVIE